MHLVTRMRMTTDDIINNIHIENIEMRKETVFPLWWRAFVVESLIHSIRGCRLYQHHSLWREHWIHPYHHWWSNVWILHYLTLSEEMKSRYDAV